MSETNERVLLLVGSPKGLERSQSARLGRLVVEGLIERGWTSESIHLHAAVESEEGQRELLEAIGCADVVLFAAPLYLDTLPAPAIRALELVAAQRRPGDVGRPPRFVSIIQCGSIEPRQNDTCQRILQRFVDRVGFEWIGGISLGGGGRIAKHARRAFDLLIEAVDLELLVPDEVERLTRKASMASRLYVIVGNAMWRRWADRNGVKDGLRARPYDRRAS